MTTFQLSALFDEHFIQCQVLLRHPVVVGMALLCQMGMHYAAYDTYSCRACVSLCKNRFRPEECKILIYYQAVISNLGMNGI